MTDDHAPVERPTGPVFSDISQAGEKPTNEELNARIHEVADLLAKGATRREICRYVQTKTTWGITIDTIDRYIKRAAALLARTARPRADYVLSLAAYRFNELYTRALVDKNYTEAREAVRDLCRLYGLPIDGVVNHGDPDDEQDRRIAILVGPNRLPNTPEGRAEWERRVQWDQANRQPSIPALEASPLLRTT